MSSSSDFSGMSHLDNCHPWKERAEKPVLLLVKFFLKNTHFYLGVCVCHLNSQSFTLERTTLKFEHILKLFLTKPTLALFFHDSLKISNILKPVGLVPCLSKKAEHSDFSIYSSSCYKALVHVKGQEMQILIQIKLPSSLNSTGLHYYSV